MTTKAPSKVQDHSAESLEKIAHSSVISIPTSEPNDRHRLGYHSFRMLSNKQGTIEQAISESGARITISPAEAKKIILDALLQQGVTIH